MTWLLNRLREPSTWRGLVWLLTACGITLRPEVWEQVTAVGMAVAGLIGVVFPDQKPLTALPPIELQSHVENDPDFSERGAADRAAGAEPDRLRLTLPPQYPAEHDERAGGPGPGWNG